VGLGVGGNVLVGGMYGSISLHPLSIEGNTGLNVAAGVAMMDLKFVSVADGHPSLARCGDTGKSAGEKMPRPFFIMSKEGWA
jgi:uncharacterized protein DUF992